MRCYKNSVLYKQGFKVHTFPNGDAPMLFLEKKCISRSFPSQLGTVSREGFESLCCLPPFYFLIPFFCNSRLNNHMTFKAQVIGSRQSVVPHAKMLDLCAS